MQSIARGVLQDISFVLKIILYCENILAPFECCLPRHILRDCYSEGSEAVTADSSDGAFAPVLSSAVETIAESMS